MDLHYGWNSFEVLFIQKFGWILWRCSYLFDVCRTSKFKRYILTDSVRNYLRRLKLINQISFTRFGLNGLKRREPVVKNTIWFIGDLGINLGTRKQSFRVSVKTILILKVYILFGFSWLNIFIPASWNSTNFMFPSLQGFISQIWLWYAGICFGLQQSTVQEAVDFRFVGDRHINAWIQEFSISWANPGSIPPIAGESKIFLVADRCDYPQIYLEPVERLFCFKRCSVTRREEASPSWRGRD